MHFCHVHITVNQRALLVIPIMACSSSTSSPSSLEDLDLDGLKREWRFGIELVEYNGFFYPREALEVLKDAQHLFQPRPDDVFLCGSPKTGTTWLKAIIVAILNTHEEKKSNVLTLYNPHQLIPNLEFDRSLNNHLAAMPFKPRVLQTHLPYSALPSSIRSLGCRIIYIARNPKDTVVSFWQFIHKFVPAVYDIHGADTSLKAVFDAFCSGVCNFGPFCDHVLSFWNATKDHPNILFLNYEDMKADISASYIRRIADFLGLSSLTDEEIERIHGQCSFEGLSALEVNQTGKFKAVGGIVDSKIFFRKGEVGDWKNYLTVEMNGRLESIVEKKLDGSDFCFRYE